MSAIIGVESETAALAAYARRRDDNELDAWISEIQVRAPIRIGELVRDLEREQTIRTKMARVFDF